MQARGRLCVFRFVISMLLGLAAAASAETDPGRRGGPASAGGPASGLGDDYSALFRAARARFMEVDSVSGGVVGEEGKGLGPTFNANAAPPVTRSPTPAAAART